MLGTGRNKACWCGNSRKYKKCHLSTEAHGFTSLKSHMSCGFNLRAFGHSAVCPIRCYGEMLSTSGRLLVLDDEPIMAHTAHRLLRRRYSVSVETDGPKALAMLERETLILSSATS
jgi:hypothetical protein